jgi:deoxyribonuclease V
MSTCQALAGDLDVGTLAEYRQAHPLREGDEGLGRSRGPASAAWTRAPPGRALRLRAPLPTRASVGEYAPVLEWPLTREELIEEQTRLAALRPASWRFAPDVQISGVFVCFPRGERSPGQVGDRAWAAACVGGSTTVLAGCAGAPYEPGLLALREGALLEAAVRALPELPDVLLVDATGRDHPRRAGLALQLGAVLELPTVGVTHRPLVAEGEWPAEERGARSPLRLGDELVGYWLRTRTCTRPLAVHAAWRADPDTAADVVMSASHARTPEPLRRARRRAREARAMDNGHDWRRRRERWQT